MKIRAKRVSIFMIFLLVMQSIVAGFVPLQTTYAEENTNHTFFDFDGITESSLSQEDSDGFLNIDWSLANYNLEEVDQTIDFQSPVALVEQKGTLSLEEGAVDIASFETTENVIRVTFNEAALEHPEAKGTLKLQVPLQEEVVEGEADEESIEKSNPAEEGTEEAAEEEVAEEKGTEEAVEKEATEEEGNEEAVEEEQAEEKGTEETVEKEAAEEKGTEEEGTKEAVEDEGTEKKDTETSAASDVGPQVELGNIFTFESLKIDDQVIEDGDIISITEGTIASLRFSWHTQGMNAKAGDTAEIGLSDAFKTVTTPVQDLIVEGTKVGTYHVEEGVLKFVFTEGIETSDVQNGFVNLGLEFNIEKFRENIEQEIPFNDGHENNITVIARPNIEHSGIEKEGHPDTKHDAREITWTIDVINTNDEEISEAALADNIPHGLGEARDFVIHKLNIGFDGDISKGDDVTSTLNPSKFPIALGTIAPFNGYRVQYTTTIENYAAESFTNDATFKYGEESLPAEATVGGLTRSNPIEKDGWQVGNTDKIQWQIDVNKNGSLISNAIIEDSLPAGLSVDPASIEVVRITQNGGNWVEGDVHEGLYTEFPINLGALGQDDAYRIKFKTDVDWSEVNNSDYQKENGFNNKATLYDGEDELNNDDATVNIVRDPVLRKEGVSNVDYENKTVSWTIHVNEAGHPIGNIVLTDLIPEGLAISESDIKITDEEGNTYTPVKIDLDPDAEGGTAVVINLGDVGTHKLKIEYTTEITDFTKNNFNNGVGMTGDGVGEAGENSNAEIKPAANTYGKSFRGIDYNAKTINWQLNVNPRREAVDSLVIEDTFPNKGMILLPDSVKVNHAGDELVEGADYTLAPRTEDGETGYHKGFTITLLDNALPLDGGQLVVNYTTSYDPQHEVGGHTLDSHVRDGEQDKVYRNRAHFEGETVNGNPIDETRNADTTVREDSWNSGKKEGQLIHVDGEGNQGNGWVSGSERKIAWQLYTNYQEQNLGTGVTITDTLAYAGNIDEGSIKVSVYNVKPDGTTEITGPVLNPDNYSVDVDGDEFTITFNNEVTERYVIEFTTSVPDISKQSYTNNAIVKVGDVEYPYSATLNYGQSNDFLKKGAIGLDGNRVFTGDEVEWKAAINESLSIIQNAVITDTISAGHIYKEGSLEVFRSQDQENALKEGTDYKLEVVAVTDENDEPTGETKLVIDIDETLKDTLVLQYTTVVTETDGDIGNRISLDGTAIDQQAVESSKLNARQFSDAGGEWAPNRGALKVAKVDEEEEKVIANNETTFTLWYDLNGERVQYTQEEAFTTVDGALEIGNLPLRTYYLVEEEAPTGYVLSEEEIEIVVDKAYGNNEENIVSTTFENTKEKIDITGTKVWEGGPKPTIELQLHRDGEPYGDPVELKDGETEYTWSDLDKTDIDGNEYEYTVDEVEVPDNYEKTISEDGLTITNTFAAGETSINVAKVWKDAENQDGIRPEAITVILLENGEETEQSLVLNESNNWEGTFTELPVIDQTGKAIAYTVKEVAVDGYETETAGSSEDGYVITNTHAPELIDLEGTKTWDDTDNQDGKRPESITIRLLANGEEAASVDVTEETEWSFAFTDLPKFENGEEINYTIQEDNVEDYSAEINGVDITNSYTPEQTSINVVKAWEDANDQDGVRPDAITVKLLADGKETGQELILNEANNWQGDFTELAVYSDGEEIQYSIEEVAVAGYETEIAGTPADGYVITNTHEPALIDLEGTKTWDDGDNQDGKRPESITVRLLANSNEVEAVEVSEESDWSYSFTNLPKFENGEEIHYTIQEDNVEDYSAEISGLDITNSYTPEQTSINVIKVWEDANNQDGARPDAITVKLLADDEETGRELTLNEANNWQGDFIELAVYSDGEEIQYSIEEVAVEGYETETAGNPADGYVITNSYEPELIDLEGTKTWDDGDNQDGKRPESITVRLLANGNEVEAVEVSEESDWSYSFTNLPKFENGEEINYTIQEDNVEGYSTKIKDLDITNSYTPEQISINVSKAWEDADDQDGVRPDAITVKLLADGEEIDSVELNESNNWQADFTELDKFKNSELIDYTVEEVAVDGYETETAGNPADGYVITNSYEPELIDLEGTKTWEDADNQDGKRPESITVRLLANGEEVASVEITEESDWNYAFTELPKFENGEEVHYTIQEDNVEDYSTEIHGLDITNSYTPKQTSINIVKVWKDANNQDGTRPDAITVKLFADGKETGQELTLNEANNWQGDFTELDVYTDGEEIQYSVEEVAVEGYETETAGNPADGYVITNSYEPELINLEGTKSWDDAKNQDGKRPESITVRLLANGNEVEAVEVSEESDWSYSFTDLPKFENGEEINYTIQEDNVEDYSTEIHGLDITNSYTPEQTSINVVKAWEDANNQDGARPDAITVKLFADGKETGQELTLNEANNWQGDFTELDVYADGEEIQYSIEEAAVEGYETETAGNPADGYVITNSYEPELINLEGTKTWDDAKNQDGKRPESITVRLFANANEVDVVKVSKESDWSYSFTDLPKFENGEEIHYTIQEDNVEGYSAKIDGLDITNSYTPDQTSINVVKSWNDANNRGGNRPDSITVKLLANGEATGKEVILSKDTNWQADFTDLDVYADGNLIKYTVEEVDVPNYESNVTADEENPYNFTVTNNYDPAKVSVGDYVWFDANKDGLQDETDVPLKGVVLTIEDKEGNPVTDVYGNPVGPTTTDKNGYYIFENLPIDNTYTVRIDREASKEALKGYVPTLEEVGDDNSIDSSTWKATSRHLTKDGDHDPTLDFGFVKEEPKKVSVGDYVWFDANKDGLQDETDVPLKGVVLTIEDKEGNPVTDVYGNPVGPTTTDKNGYYIFENLPIDNTYTVRIDREASKEALKGYVPTLEEGGDDKSIDSSTWFATSRHLTEDGDHDPTLDFGFVKAESEEDPGKDPGKDPEEDPGKDPGKDPGEDPGKDPGKGPGEDPDKDPGKGPGEDPDKDPGKDSGKEPGKESQEVSGKTDSGDSKGTDGNNGGTLPDTATSLFNILLIGLGLLAAGAILLIVSRFRKPSSS
ncbi:hypothetical protein J14TS2_34460 [Bacillus sp. J14TS2]|uniref:Cna B-type domain-containing protein n=1 Tax=Bacillus sp. J14TS2 TaxID=2807188 RepID=UPI001B1E7E69|nr:Cna B-type domain-containing protein [Bacillus sp. J14TS2]GIN72971.1 hypothetical protein J14TS2_34460 [Bacillus sp. J14TS2]